MSRVVLLALVAIFLALPWHHLSVSAKSPTKRPTKRPTLPPTPHPTVYIPSVIEAGTPVGNWPLLTVPIMFHVHHKVDGTGNVTYARLLENVAQLNRAFSAQEARQAKYGKATDSNIRFTLFGVRYVPNDTWFTLCALPSTIVSVRPVVQQPPARYLNIYICYNSANLGLSWLPYVQWYKDFTDENHFAMSVIVHHELVSINNVFKGRWSQGDIMTHEVGHFFGLKHTYESGCWGTEASSDYLGDTPRTSGNPSDSCAAANGRDTCPKLPGKDDIRNYMTIYFDSCRSHFTPNQVEFMRRIARDLKPTLVSQLPTDYVACIDKTDASPDLLPCVDGTLRNDTTHSPTSRMWCLTDKFTKNPAQWAFAGNNEDASWCRAGTPNFYSPFPVLTEAIVIDTSIDSEPNPFGDEEHQITDEDGNGLNSLYGLFALVPGLAIAIVGSMKAKRKVVEYVEYRKSLRVSSTKSQSSSAEIVVANAAEMECDNPQFGGERATSDGVQVAEEEKTTTTQGEVCTTKPGEIIV